MRLVGNFLIRVKINLEVIRISSLEVIRSKLKKLKL